MRLTRCFYFSLSIRPGMSEEEKTYERRFMDRPDEQELFPSLFIFSLCQINFHFFSSSPLFQSTLLISFWLQLVMRGAII